MSRDRWAQVLCLFAGIATAQAPNQDTAHPRVAGLVQTADGRALAGARVLLTGLLHPELPPTVAFSLGAEAELRIEGTADDKGVFRIELPHHGPFSLLATTADGQTSGRRFPVMATDFVTVKLRARSVIEGTVRLAGGRPAAGARVGEATYTGAGMSRERFGNWVPPVVVTADDQGRFRLEVCNGDPEGLPLSTKAFKAWTDGCAMAERWYRLDGQPLTGIAATLVPTPPNAGRIVAAEDRSAIAGAEILDVEETRRSVRTGADGRFVFDNELQAALVVRAPGRALRGLRGNPGDCELQRGAVVRGRLLGKDGAGKQRRVALATRDSGEVPFHIAWLTSTAADGRLEIDEARAGEPLYGFVEDAGRFVSFLRVMPTTAPLDLGDVRVDAGRTVSGAILTHDGLRCGGAMVMLQPAFADVPRAMAS
ncbi:MAG TPA: hypothetical protein VK348_13035, partial [Planctomycetota bacterium]|nr:hypothetical protein [Planctomycetota bacterium]